MLSASPPRAVSLYLSFMSAPVSRMVLIALSSGTWCRPSPRTAIRAAVMALTEPTAFRSMQGIWTSPPTGSQVSPRWCSMPISAAFSTCSGVPPKISASAPAAGCVLLVHRQSPQGDPVQRPQRVDARPEPGVGHQLGVQVGGPSADLQSPRQHPGSVAAVLDALLHHPPDL